jgi:hypothetical protein
MLTLNTVAPQGCVLSPYCTHDSNTIIKFADDTTLVGLIVDANETAYRKEVRALAEGLPGKQPLPQHPSKPRS